MFSEFKSFPRRMVGSPVRHALLRTLLPALLLATGLAGGACAAEPGMAATANGFYGVYKTFHPSSGIPSPADRAKYGPFLSPALDKLLGDADAAETRFAKENKDSPPLVEGDLFTSMFEGATSAQVGDCSGDNRSGHCTIKLEYADPSNKPVAWTDTVYLVNTPADWRVDDIAYGASWAFGNKGRLSDTLKQAIGFQ